MGSITHVVAGLRKEAAVTGQGDESAFAGQGNGAATDSWDSTGCSILNHYEYDAWGNLTACEETVPNRFKFNGQQYDPVTQQYYLRARYYNPVIGRFLQEDTYRGDGLNLYTYCRNNPVYYVDPSGHAVISCERAQEHMRRARDAGQRIQDIDTKTANQLREWYKFKSDHDWLTPDEIDLARQIGLDVDGTEGGTGLRTYQTYTKTNPKTGKVYSGRTSGTGTPAENVRRDANHHMNDEGFGPAVLDRSSSSSQAIRGREQMLIDYHGGAQSTGGNSGNAINGISSNNKNRDNYINAARGEFGDIE